MNNPAGWTPPPSTVDGVRVGGVLDPAVPSGPLPSAWRRRKLDYALVQPANRRKLKVIVVGTGLAGAGVGAALGELGYEVECFTYHDAPRRAHSVAAQGGVNAAREGALDSDSLERFARSFAEKDAEGVFRYEPPAEAPEPEGARPPEEWFDTSTDPEIAQTVAAAEAAARTSVDSDEPGRRRRETPAPKPGVFDMVPESEGGSAGGSESGRPGEDGGRQALPQQQPGPQHYRPEGGQQGQQQPQRQMPPRPQPPQQQDPRAWGPHGQDGPGM